MRNKLLVFIFITIFKPSLGFAACFLSFVNGGQSPDININFGNLSKGEAQSVTFYETCQNDYIIAVISTNGGAQASVRQNKVDYNITYSSAGETAASDAASAVSTSPLSVVRSISALRTVNHASPTWTPASQPATLTFNMNPGPLPTGVYNDTIIIEMLNP